MLSIRRGVFETNSSSSHSIVVTKGTAPVDKVMNTWRVRDDGELWMSDYDLEFGRGFDMLTDWYGRLRYYIAEYIDDEGPELDALTEICRKHIDGFDHFHFDEVTWSDDHRINYGYVDHQSMGHLRGFIKNHDLTPEEFIFNDRYIVVIDGDEYNIFDTLQKTPMYNPDNIEEVY